MLHIDLPINCGAFSASLLTIRWISQIMASFRSLSEELGIPRISSKFSSSIMSCQNSACSSMASHTLLCSVTYCDVVLEDVISSGRLAGIECGNVLTFDVVSFVGRAGAGGCRAVLQKLVLHFV